MSIRENKCVNVTPDIQAKVDEWLAGWLVSITTLTKQIDNIITMLY